MRKIWNLGNSRNKHQNNPLVGAETVRHSSTYIILDIFYGIYCSMTKRSGLSHWKIIFSTVDFKGFGGL